MPPKPFPTRPAATAAATATAAAAATTAATPPPPRTPPTHFLCIPLATSKPARAQLATSLSAFRADVCAPPLGFGAAGAAGGAVDIPPDAVRPVGTLHLTLGVMSFPERGVLRRVKKEKGLDRAREVLAGVGLAGVWRAVVAEWRARMAIQGRAITLRGLASMQPADRAAVLYAPPVDQFGLLQAFCERVRDVFRDAELMVDEGRPLLLHATVVNTVYVKGRGGKGGRKRERLVFDATDIIERYEDQVWIKDIPVEKVAIYMTPPSKRRPPSGAGPKGGSTNGPRSPPRPTRTSPSNTRNTNTGSNSTNNPSNSTFISPPPRAALSGTSSPAPDNPRNSNNTTTKDSPHLAPTTTRTAGRNRSPSPSPLPKTATTTTTTTTATAGTTTATSAAIATCQSALREKDVRIASLERELALMESEFHRELDKLSSAESETAAFWQAKYAALEKTRGARCGVVEGGGGGGVEVEGELREARGAWERVRDMLDQKEDEVAELKAQVRGLKEWVSVSTRADGEAQTSDEVFGEGMARLGNGLQNWVLVNFRRARVADLSGSHEDTISELARLVPMYEELASTSRIHLLQSVVSRFLVELVFGAYFIGLPTDVAAQIKQVEDFLSSASSPESVNQWRSLTLTTIKKDASEKLQTETSKVVETVVSKVNDLLDPLTNTKSTEARDQGLQALVHSAIELSRLLAVQKAVFKIEMPEILPHQCIVFNGETMEDIGGEDEDSLADREICCVTFPGIIKRGDESGGHLQYRNVISKAKVLCSPE
ncbi:AKAP7 2'5' RNA ligase-like domain-containing protein [Chaetomium fimeti]|uniref:AKAP7 2'5' RNA ligase-like domain-containing protein n=1 Tax=Chaetomium fimeti TaxID=1854472 RepID=A0AAE0HBH6_9PEZI|nr:AKAP7 2'5' RNA ligase-like domain-containing protein [Chaetomium fimeti]